MTNTRLAIAIEQVEIIARDQKMEPLEVVKGFDKGTTAQKEIYKAIKEKHPPEEKPNA